MLEQKERKQEKSPLPIIDDMTLDQMADVEETAKRLLSTADEMVIQYARPCGPKVKMKVIKGKTIIDYEDFGNGFVSCNTSFNKEGLEDNIDLKLYPGTPTGAALAFLHEGEVHIGWSKRNTALYTKDEDIDDFVSMWLEPDSNAAAIDAVMDIAREYAKKTEMEPLPFSKENARTVAVIRGLCCNVVRKNDQLFASDKNGNNLENIPEEIQDPLKTVIFRAEKYFKDKKIANLIVIQD